MSVIYRTTDALQWGVGKGSRLTSTELDNNFWGIVERLIALEGDLPTPAEIDYFNVVDGDQLYVHLTDHRALGPVTLPSAQWSFQGVYSGGRSYSKFDVFRQDGNIYLVLLDHTSPLIFDAGANDGNGHDYYALLLSPPTAGQYRGEWTAFSGYHENDTFKVTTGESTGFYRVIYDHDAGAIFDPDYEVLSGIPVYELLFPLTFAYDIALFVQAPFQSDELVYITEVRRAFSLPENCSGSGASLAATNSGTDVFSLQKNGVEFGTITFTSDAVGVIVSDATSFEVGNFFSLVAPNSPTLGLASFTVTLLGVR